MELGERTGFFKLSGVLSLQSTVLVKHRLKYLCYKLHIKYPNTKPFALCLHPLIPTAPRPHIT